MQQMSNILLGVGSKSADASLKNNMQDVENTSFLSAFNQASERSLVVKTPPNNLDATQVEPPIVDESLDNELSMNEEVGATETSDADMIFAQLNMADSLGKRRPHDGNQLPLIDKHATYTDRSLTLEPIENSVDEVSVELTGVDFESIDLESIGIQSTSAQLFETTTASVKDELVIDFNLQVPAVDESILAMAELENDAISDDVINILNPEQQNEIDNALAASMMGQPNVSQINSVTSTFVKSQPMIDESVQSTVGQTTSWSIDPKNVLGDKTRVDGNIQSSAYDVTILKQAEMSVVLETAATKRVVDFSANIAPTDGVFEMVGDGGDVDSQVLQNQSSFTPVHKSEVPQFQLSLRPQADATNQMQEMIQKFSPLMKQQLITMVSNGIQQAEIRLDPPELGHLTVKIQIQGDQTQVQFHVAQSQTRELVEQAIPRLRDMLASEGLQLTDSQVSQGGSGREQQGQSEQQGQTAESQLDEISAQDANLMTNTSRSLHSAIDYYA
ncbi:flagellar hook-length control protein FliK [Shewanella sp.]|uniref:flagellar hook-length control protein FliK n=1 Tax=Shewanella sp. TaxID=50422 RepID=UPI0040489C9C